MRLVLRVVDVCLLSILFASSAVAGPPSVPRHQSAPKADSSSFPQEAGVVEDLETKARFENDGTVTYDRYVRVRIQAESAVTANGLLAFSYLAGDESLEINYVRVRKPDGSTIDTPLDSVQDLTSEVTRSAPMYTSQHEKHVAVKGLAVGDLLEYRSLLTLLHPLTPGQFSFSFNFSKQSITLRERLEIDLPKGRAVKVVCSSVTPVVSSSGDGARAIYTFQSAHLKKDPDPDKWQLALDGAPTADVRASSFASWDEVAGWYGALQRARVQVTPEIRAKAEELTRDKKTSTEKLQAIYDYVSTKFRYISISLGQGRYAPHFAAEVLSSGFGDCKDKHTLLAALLQAVGIDAYPVLIGTSVRIDPQIPTPEVFDHLITVVPQGSSFLWLDTTPGIAPFGFLSAALRDKLALIILPEGKALLNKTPADPPFPMFQRFSITATLDASGTLEGKARLETRGDAELALRAAFRNTPQPQWKDLAQVISGSIGFAGTVDDVTAANPEDTSTPWWLAYSYHRPEFGDWPNHQITLPLPPVALPLLSKEETDSPAALPLGAVQEISYEAQVTLPKGFLPLLPAAIADKRDFAEYKSSYQIDNGVIHGSRHLRVLLREVSAGNRPAYASLSKDIDEDERRWIHLIPGDAAIASARSSNSEAQRLFDEASQSVQLGAPWAASKSIEQALKLDPTWVDAWLLLGRARLMNSQTDPAFAAYRKAISLAPSDAAPYKVLAESLVSHFRVPEALQVWRDLLKVAPEDRDASTNLAALLVQSSRYAEARPLLEKLLEKDVSTAELHFQLGVVYFHLGEDENSAEQFRKALDLQPGPEMLNSIAYSLAEANHGLVDALRYAEQAVEQTEGQTSVFQLASAQQGDYALMNLLVAEWDTLGWVHFRRGELASAEKYLAAAWRLIPDPIVGSHLAQVYEKQGKKALATRTYIAALHKVPVNGDPQLRDTLFSRAKAGNPPDSLWMTAPADADRGSKFTLRRLPGNGTFATFGIVFSKDSTVEEVKLLRGPDELRPAEPLIAALKFDVLFPDDTPTRILRLGALKCFPTDGNCTFELISPPSSPRPPKAP
jgi:Tfp pilus assembly protein PilF